MRILIILSIIISFGLPSMCQVVDYPLPILPGQTKTISANQDTLWVLKDKQLNRVITIGNELKFANLELIELKNKSIVLTRLGHEKDSLVSILKTDRDYYQKIWRDCNTEIIPLAKKLDRCQKIRKMAFIGIGVALVGGFIAGYFAPHP